MHYKRLLTLIDGVSSYLSVGLDVGADFTWMSIALPNGSFIGKPLRKSVCPFGGDLWFGWLGSLRLYLYKPLGCVSAFWKWMPAGKDFYHALQKITYID